MSTKRCRIPVIGKQWLPMFLVLALLPSLARATDTTTLDYQLMAAASRGDEVLVERLLTNGADVNQMPRDGWTPLMSAASGLEWIAGQVVPGNDMRLPWRAEPSSLSGRTNVAKLLLEKGADLNAKDKDGRTALMMASGQGHTDMVKLLLEKGADITAKDSSGLTALYWASSNGHTQIVELLKAHGAKE